MNASTQIAEPCLSRRSLLKWSAAIGGSTALVGGAVGAATRARADDGLLDADQTVWSSCLVNCGSRCPVRLQVKDGVVVRVLTDNTGGDELGDLQIRACPRGRSIRNRFYNPDRIKKPLKRRPGTKRGEEVWDEISWEQALDEIAVKYQEILADYGPEAVHQSYGTGVIAPMVSQSYPYGGAVRRLLNLFGGSLGFYGDYSTGGITEAMRIAYGGYFDGNSSDDLANTKLLVLWGHSPMETKMSGGSEVFYLGQLKKKHDFKVIVVDPRQSDSAVILGDEWIAPRPGTDAALVAGLAYELVKAELHDQEFLDRYCIGFDEDQLPDGAPANSSYHSYLMGKGPDGIEKTPQWAASITGVPATQIIQFARTLGQNRPSAIQQGWGPQRHSNGENQAWAVITLNALLGNVGLPGGGTGTNPGQYGLSLQRPFWDDGGNPVTAQISHFTWLEAIKRGPEMTARADGVRGVEKLSQPLKFLFLYGSNVLINQHSEINNTRQVLQDDSLCELIVVCDTMMTSSAKFADYVLPGTSNAEEEDLIGQGMSANMGYTILASQAIEPQFESRPIYEICRELAKRMGKEQEFTQGRTQAEWVADAVEASRETVPGLPSYEQFKKQGIYKIPGETVIGMAEFRADPEANPLDTPSGKIEIYSAQVAEIAEGWELADDDVVTPIPAHIETFEGPAAARESTEFPLQMIGNHFKGRTHSSYGNVAWLQEAHIHSVWINTVDAQARGIAQDDLVEVFNDRGRIRLPAKVTARIHPGVVSVPNGAWYLPDADGVDLGGCPNTLTSARPSALAKTNPQYTNLVEVTKV